MRRTGTARSLVEHLDRVRVLLRLQPFGLFVDLDGTMSPIVDDPMAARPTEAAVRSLAVIRRKGGFVAVVSGRAATVARAMVGLRGITYVGSHGLETYEGGRQHRARGLNSARGKVAQLIDRLTPLLVPLGVTVEHKDASVAFHLRRAREPGAARAALEHALSQAPEARDLARMPGRQVVELRARGRGNKGTAVRRLAMQHRLRSLIYIGDDQTDIFAFEAVRVMTREQQLTGLSAAVFDSETAPEVATAADFVLEGVPAVERFLAWLAGEL